eukprot:NODE_88_length_21932_cov_0.317867.p7 type:complete len:320 gc:universal NODE_88_length_21932_cov_0.317867:8910-7951(-)
MLSTSKFVIFSQISNEKADKDIQTDNSEQHEQSTQVNSTVEKSTETEKVKIISLKPISLFEEAINENIVLKDIYKSIPHKLFYFTKSISIIANIIALSESWCIAVDNDNSKIYKISDTITEYPSSQMITCINADVQLLGTELGNILHSYKSLKPIHEESITSIHDDLVVCSNGFYKNKTFYGTEEASCSFIQNTELFIGSYTGNILEIDLNNMTTINTSRLSDYPIKSFFVKDSIIYACTAFEFIVHQSKIIYRESFECIQVELSILGCLLVSKIGLFRYHHKKLQLVLQGQFKGISTCKTNMALLTETGIDLYQMSPL